MPHRSSLVVGLTDCRKLARLATFAGCAAIDTIDFLGGRDDPSAT